MFIIITLFTVVRGFDAIIAVSSMTVQNKTLMFVTRLSPLPFHIFPSLHSGPVRTKQNLCLFGVVLTGP